jgi:hypothetical protein
LWDIMPYSLVETYRRYWGMFCSSALNMKEARSSETSIYIFLHNAQCHISEYMDTTILITINPFCLESLGFWTLSIVRYSRIKKTQRFGNSHCFRPQVRGGGRHLFSWVP